MFYYCSLSLVQESTWGVNLRSSLDFSETAPFPGHIWSLSDFSSIYRCFWISSSLKGTREKWRGWGRSAVTFKYPLQGTLSRGAGGCNNACRDNNSGYWTFILHLCNQKQQPVIIPLILDICKTSPFCLLWFLWAVHWLLQGLAHSCLPGGGAWVPAARLRVYCYLLFKPSHWKFQDFVRLQSSKIVISERFGQCICYLVGRQIPGTSYFAMFSKYSF